MTSLAPILQEYFTAYLVTQRAMSEATIRTYRDTWKLFLGFLSQTADTPVFQLKVTDIDAARVLAFLDHLQTQRGNSVATRNLRLAAIKSVMAFYATKDPERLDTVAQIHAIPVKRTPKPQPTFLTSSQTQALLDSISIDTWTGRRDHAMFTLAVQTGLRLSEITALHASSLHDEPLVVQHLEDLGPLARRQGPRLRRRLWSRRAGRGRGLAVVAVVGGPRASHRRARRPHPDQRGQLGDGGVGHVSLSFLLLPAARLSNRAESFDWTSITWRAVSSSPLRRWTCRRSRAASATAGSAGGAPDGRPNASSAPASRWARHALINDVYRPSRRSNAPFPARSHASYSASTSRLYFAEYVRRTARSGTCGSGTSAATRPDCPATRLFELGRAGGLSAVT